VVELVRGRRGDLKGKQKVKWKRDPQKKTDEAGLLGGPHLSPAENVRRYLGEGGNQNSRRR